MKVVAVRQGFYGLKRIYPGDEFTLQRESDFSERWMKKMETKKVDPESHSEATPEETINKVVPISRLEPVKEAEAEGVHLIAEGDIKRVGNRKEKRKVPRDES